MEAPEQTSCPVCAEPLTKGHGEPIMWVLAVFLSWGRSRLCPAVAKSHYCQMQESHPLRLSPTVLQQAGYAHTAEHGSRLQLSPGEPTHVPCLAENLRGIRLSAGHLCAVAAVAGVSPSIHSLSDNMGFLRASHKSPDRGLICTFHNPRNDHAG